MWKQKLIILVALITVGGGVTTMVMTIPCAPVLARPSVDNLLQTVNICICVCEVVCCSVRIQVVVSLLPCLGNGFLINL